MNLTLVVQALRARCPSFSQRFAAAAQFKVLPEGAQLAVPAGFVVPLDDTAEPNQSQNGYRQPVQDSFAVIVALPNTVDERGQASAASVHSLRLELFKALLGWQPEADYDGIVYEGGQLLAMDRARLWYQFEFSAGFEIGADDIGNVETWQAQELAALPMLEEIKFTLDAYDPADPNVAPHGPDGRPEAEAVVTIPTT